MRSLPAERISDLLLVCGASTVAFLFFCILLGAAGFFLGVPVSSSYFYAAGALTLAFAVVSSWMAAAWLPRSNKGGLPHSEPPGLQSRPSQYFGGRIGSVLLVVMILAVSFYAAWGISRAFFDISYDGQGYHQEAILQLSSGWNPFSQPLTESQANHMGYWLQHYSKGVWIYQTILFKTTGELEGAKLFHFWLMAAAFFVVLSFFMRFRLLPRPLAVLVSFLAAFSPVAIYQSLSFYLDGQLMSLLIILLALLAFLYRESRGYYYLILFMVISVLVNVKLTAAIYTLLFLAAYLLLLQIRKKRRLIFPVSLTAAPALLVGMAFLGFSPYVTNTLYQGNPFYPALGTDRSDYTNPQFPANFQGRDPVSLLFFSIFAKCDNVRGPNKHARWKIPFTVSREELSAFTDTNAKQGGFGPLFGGAVLLSFFIFMAAGKRLFRLSSSRLGGGDPGRERSGIILGLFASAALLVTCVINPASSLARFIPQMWLVPLIAFLLAWFMAGRFLRLAGCALLLILLLNNLLIGLTYYPYNRQITRLYQERLGAFASGNENHQFYFGDFLSSNILRFDRLGIRYDIVENAENCYNGHRILPHSIILKCAGQ